VEALIGRETVDTVPPATLQAFRDHGKAQIRLEEGIDDAKQVLATLARFGISLDALNARLLEYGVREFSEAFDKLLAAVEKKVRGSPPLSLQSRP
jgi:transaldolase/glucose-6-phosphate isomerase